MVLGLDLGTKTGYAVLHTDAKFMLEAGTWRLASPKELKEQTKIGGERRHDIRYSRLYLNIVHMIATYDVRLVVFEDVQFASTTMQAHLWGALRAAVWHIKVYKNNVDIQCVPVGTLKKFATNNGGADKHDMARALKAHPIYAPICGPGLDKLKLDDNAVDAVWLTLFAQMMIKEGLPWTSVWDRRNEAKALKKEKTKIKKEKLLQKRKVLNQ